MYEIQMKKSQLRLQNMQTAGKDAQSDNDEIPIVDTLSNLLTEKPWRVKYPVKEL